MSMSKFICFVDGPCTTGVDFCHLQWRMCQRCSDYLELCFTESHIPNCTTVCKEALKEQWLRDWKGDVTLDISDDCLSKPYFWILVTAVIVLGILLVLSNFRRILKACKRIRNKWVQRRIPNERPNPAQHQMDPLLQNQQPPPQAAPQPAAPQQAALPPAAPQQVQPAAPQQAAQQPEASQQSALQPVAPQQSALQPVAPQQAAQQPVAPQQSALQPVAPQQVQPAAPQQAAQQPEASQQSALQSAALEPELQPAAQPAAQPQLIEDLHQPTGVSADPASQPWGLPQQYDESDQTPRGSYDGGQLIDEDQTKAWSVYQPREQPNSWAGSSTATRNSSVSSGTPFLVQETDKGAAGKHIGAMQPRNRAMEQPLADKRAGQHGWELSEDPDFEMQNGHVPSMEPNCHGYDTVPHGRKLAVGNHMGEIDRHDIKRSSSHGSPTLRV